MTVVLILNQSIHTGRLAVGLDDHVGPFQLNYSYSTPFYSILLHAILKITELSPHSLGYSLCFGFPYLCFLVCSSAEKLTPNFAACAWCWPSEWKGLGKFLGVTLMLLPHGSAWVSQSPLLLIRNHWKYPLTKHTLNRKKWQFRFLVFVLFAGCAVEATQESRLWFEVAQ